MVSPYVSMVPQEGDPFRGVAIGLRGRNLGQHGDHHGEGGDVHHGGQEVLGRPVLLGFHGDSIDGYSIWIYMDLCICRYKFVDNLDGGFIIMDIYMENRINYGKHSR